MKDIEFTYLRQGPTKWTFQMPLLRKWVEEHSHGSVLNLFAGRVRLNLDEYRVDMSTEYNPDLNMEAELALRKFIAERRFFDTVILDPPYSLRMAREKYNGKYYIGKFAKILNLVPRVLNKNGIVITLGYKTAEMSASRGFEVKAICLIHQGGGHDDIIGCQEISMLSDYYLHGTSSRWVNHEEISNFEQDE